MHDKRYRYVSVTKNTKEIEIRIEGVLYKENDKFLDLTYAGFEDRVEHLRDEYLVTDDEKGVIWKREKHHFIMIDPMFDMDHYQNSHKVILAFNDKNMQKIKELLDVIFNANGKKIEIGNYIRIVYYLIFDKFIRYEELRKVYQKYNFAPLTNFEKAFVSVKDFELQTAEYLQSLQSDRAKMLLKSAREIIGIVIDESIASIGENYKKYYRYILGYGNYAGMFDEFLKDINNIINEYEELDYRNELDYLYILNYLMYGKDLEKEEMKKQLSRIVINGYTADYFDEHIDYDRSVIYFGFPIYTDSYYINSMRGKMLEDLAAQFHLSTGGKRTKGAPVRRRNELIYNIYKKYKNGKLSKDGEKERYCSEEEACRKTYEEFDKLFPNGISNTKVSPGANEVAKIIRSMSKNLD